jgi:hypothetical protein
MGAIMRILVVTSLILFCLGFFDAGHSDTKKHTSCLDGETVHLYSYAELNSAQKKLADRIYKWERKMEHVPVGMSERQVIKNFDIAKKDMLLAFADLNNDKRMDLISVPSRYYCGNGYARCGLVMFLQPKFTPIYLHEYISLGDPPLRILEHQTNGIRDLLINGASVCTFDAQYGSYACQNDE